MISRLVLVAFAAAFALPALGQSIDFGDDRGDYAYDGECDDRRFTGPGMAKALDADFVRHDATDCEWLYQLGEIQLWDEDTARAATDCAAIPFGDNASEWANDGECDDPRFESRSMHSILLPSDLGHDASDCQAACEKGRIFLRNYPTALTATAPAQAVGGEQDGLDQGTPKKTP